MDLKDVMLCFWYVICSLVFGLLSSLCFRSMWQRAGAVRLFIEHVTLFSEQDDGVNSEGVVRLWKVPCALRLLITI